MHVVEEEHVYSFFLDEAAATDSTGSNGWFTWVLLALMAVFFYFFIIRPSRKQDKEAAQMRDNLAVGDEITTIGGVIGEIVSIKGETIVIETSKVGTKIRFLKTAVRSVDVHAADKYGTPATSGEPAATENQEKK